MNFSYPPLGACSCWTFSRRRLPPFFSSFLLLWRGAFTCPSDGSESPSFLRYFCADESAKTTRSLRYTFVCVRAQVVTLRGDIRAGCREIEACSEIRMVLTRAWPKLRHNAEHHRPLRNLRVTRRSSESVFLPSQPVRYLLSHWYSHRITVGVR